jgi:hypothetical protein
LQAAHAAASACRSVGATHALRIPRLTPLRGSLALLNRGGRCENSGSQLMD